MGTIDYKETGKIDVYYLKKIWWYYHHLRTSGDSPEHLTVEWKYINALFKTLRIGIEPTLKFLFKEEPSFDQFEDWIIKNGAVSSEMINHFNTIISLEGKGDLKINKESNILSSDDLKKWRNKGYVVIKNAIEKKNCKETVDMIYKTINADPMDKRTWYGSHPLKQGIMVQLFQNKILNKNRLSIKIRKAYEQLWSRKDLLVSMDRVSFNPPESKTYQFPGPNLHWDVSLKRPIPFGLQGLLYLTDTKKNQGAFTVIPGFHNKIELWLEDLPIGSDPRDPELFKNEIKEPIAGDAGDFIIWNQCLPHGSSPNTSDRPRIVQYINYEPIEMEYQTEWI